MIEARSACGELIHIVIDCCFQGSAAQLEMWSVRVCVVVCVCVCVSLSLSLASWRLTGAFF